MCGITGIVAGRGSAATLESVGAMCDVLSHRGPDDRGVFVDPDVGVALGHRRLSIVDLSPEGHQPMPSASGRYVVVYNGEIYNFRVLADELRALGARFRGHSDTEVLLAAYQEWGAECLPRLNGMFAFALWDARQRRLLVARDRFGEKPMFFARLPRGGIAFASEAKALFAHPDLGAAIDQDTLGSYVAGRYFEHDEPTLFKGIKRLPGAHAMTVDERGEVASVRKVSGPVMLQDAAKEAIKKWKFKPFVRDGQPVKANGFVSFSFSI